MYNVYVYYCMYMYYNQYYIKSLDLLQLYNIDFFSLIRISERFDNREVI
jgi:hypothetical protein